MPTHSPNPSPYVFEIERGHDGQTSLIKIPAGTEQAARLKAINEAVGPTLIVKLVEVIDPARAY